MPLTVRSTEIRPPQGLCIVGFLASCDVAGIDWARPLLGGCPLGATQASQNDPRGNRTPVDLFSLFDLPLTLIKEQRRTRKRARDPVGGRINTSCCRRCGLNPKVFIVFNFARLYTGRRHTLSRGSGLTYGSSYIGGRHWNRGSGPGVGTGVSKRASRQQGLR